MFGLKDLDLSEDDYEEMIYLNFNKYQINLREEKDKILFKNFLVNDFQINNIHIENERNSNLKKEKMQMQNNRLEREEPMLI